MASPKFLLVNEQAYIRDILRKTLNNHFPNCMIADASRANKALAFLSMSRFDMVISDHTLPDMPVIDFAKTAHKQETNRSTSFLAILEENPDDNDIDDLEEAGITQHMVLPINAKSLINNVTTLLKEKGKLPDDFRELPPGIEVSGLAALSFGKGDMAKKKGSEAKGRVTLIFNRVSSEAFVMSTSLREINCLCSAEDFYPALKDKVHITLYELNGDYVTEMDAFVAGLALAEPKINAPGIKLQLALEEMRPDRAGALSNFISG